MKIHQLILISFLLATPIIANEAADATETEVAIDLPEGDDMGNAFRAFDDDLRTYENVCDQIPIEENPVWKVWLARIASTIYGTCIATKKMTLRYYHACRSRVIKVYRSLARRAATSNVKKTCRTCRHG